MKNTIITSLLSLVFLGATAQSYTNKEFKTIENFLIEFQETVKSQNKEKLLKLVVHLDIENKNTAEIIANKALLGDENTNKDFAYSDKAMGVLISQHTKKFTPISEELKQLLYKNDEFHKVISKRTNEEVAMFSHEGVHIVLILDEGTTKLLFWEKLNNFLK